MFPSCSSGKGAPGGGREFLMETLWKVTCRVAGRRGDKRPPRLFFCFRARAPQGRGRGRWLGAGASSRDASLMLSGATRLGVCVCSLSSYSYNCFNPKAYSLPHLLCPSDSSSNFSPVSAIRGNSRVCVCEKKEPSPKSPPPPRQVERNPRHLSPSLTCFSPKAAAVSSLSSPGSAPNPQQEQPLPTRPEFRIPLSPTLHLVTSLTHKEGALRDVINACWERKQKSWAWQRYREKPPSISRRFKY